MPRKLRGWSRSRARGVRVRGDISEEAQCNRRQRGPWKSSAGWMCWLNNAAHQRTVSGVVDVSTELLDKTFKTNIYAMFWLVKAAIPHMPQGGTIINVGSAQAFKPSPTLLPTPRPRDPSSPSPRAWPRTSCSMGCGPTCVAPGPVWTPIIPASMEGETVSQFGAQSPMGRPGQLVELAPPCLLDSDASYVDGTGHRRNRRSTGSGENLTLCLSSTMVCRSRSLAGQNT